MSVEENKEVVLRYIDRINKQDSAAIDDFFTNNFVVHDLGSGKDTTVERESFKQARSILFTTYPDFLMTVHDIVTEGDTVAARVTEERSADMRITRCIFIRLENGKMAELWELNRNLDA